MRYLFVLLLFVSSSTIAQKKDTCHCDIDYNGLAITYNARWKCYLVNIWYVERKFLCYRELEGWHFQFPDIEAPYRFKTLCEAERTYQYKYLHDVHEEDLKTVKGTKPFNQP